MINPFAVRLVIKDPAAFYGRSAELSDLFTRLGAMQCCSVVGPRRIGKSSLLYYLTQVYHRYLADADNYVFAFLDLQELTGLGIDDFFETAVLSLQAATRHPALTHLDAEQYGTMRGFRRLLMKIRGANIKLVLCLDEFEMLSENKQFGVEFFTYLRGLCSNYDLALVTSSRSSLFELCHQGNLQTSQFWNIFVELNLGLLTETEATSLIEEPFASTGRKLTAEEVTFVKKWAGRHPFFIQTCCYHLFMHPINEVVARFMAEATPHYSYALNHLPASLQSVLIRLAQGQPLLLTESEFITLHKQAVVTGTGVQPHLVSQGWQRFLDQYAASSLSVQPQLSPSPPLDLPHLRNLLLRHFSESELADLCFDLHIEYDELGGNEKRSKARNLVSRLEREGRLSELVAIGSQLRPQADWPGQPTQPTTTPVTRSPLLADFSLKIEQVDNQTCQVWVLDSPAGQDSITCSLPFDLSRMEQIMVNVGNAVTRGGQTPVSTVSPAEIGQSLFEAIFTGPIGQLFFESWGEVSNKGQGLRIKLHIDPVRSPQIAALPWEFLYNGRRRRYLSLNRRTPIVRYLDVPAPTTRPHITAPLRILVAIASPDGHPPLDLVQEQTAIRHSWGQHPQVAVHFLSPASPAALHQQLHHWQPHVVHFMGHGQFDLETGEGVLLFTDETNQALPLTGVQLGNLLLNTPSVQLAFLNACQTAVQTHSHTLDPFNGVATSLVLAGLPAVVAMQFPITDEAALAFATGFYAHLSIGEPVDQAVTFGREALHLAMADSLEWGTPVLLMRVRDGHLFEIGQ